METTLDGTLLQRGALVSGPSLIDAVSGGRVSLSSFRQRRGVLLLLMHDRCEACAVFVRQTASSAGDLTDVGVAARVIVEAAAPEPPGAAVPIPVLLDPERRFTYRVMGPHGALPVVLLVDRFNSAWQAWDAWGHEFPSQTDIVDTAVHMMMTCDDCSAPLW